jgi:sodium pump decarboxylase gamma subunit
MIKDAAIVMILGMGTVFLVLVVLLGLMTLGGRIALRYAQSRPVDAPPSPATDAIPSAVPANGEQESNVAVAVAAANQRRVRQERGVSA